MMLLVVMVEGSGTGKKRRDYVIRSLPRVRERMRMGIYASVYIYICMCIQGVGVGVGAGEERIRN